MNVIHEVRVGNGNKGGGCVSVVIRQRVRRVLMTESSSFSVNWPVY